MLHISEEQVRQALPMAKAVELVERAFQRLASGRAVNHPRRRILLENRALLHAMDAADNDSGLLGAKLYVTRPGVGAHFVVVLFDAETTLPLATIDADLLGQIRTGAASGVATKFMARTSADELALIGAGWQAEAQLEAIAAVRRLRQARVFSRTPEKREEFARKMSEKLEIDVRPAASAQEAVADASIVATITSSKKPVFSGAWLAEGCHVNAAGSNHARRRELDDAAVSRAAIVAVDSLEQARIEAGDLIQAAAVSRFDWGRAVELSAIVAGRKPGRDNEEQITLFESLGLAIEDLAVAEWVYRQVAQGAG